MTASDSHCYLISKALTGDGKVLAIAATLPAWVGNIVIVAVHVEGDETQMWERRPLADGTYALINKAANMCIARNDIDPGVPLTLGPIDNLESYTPAHWRDDTVPGPYNAINSLLDWEQKINIPGDPPYFAGLSVITWKWSGGAPNELWQQKSAGDPAYTLLSIAFDAATLQVEDLQPVYGADMGYTNLTSQRVEETLTANPVLATTYDFQPAAGAPDIQVAYHGARPSLDESGALVLLDGDWRYGTGNAAGVTVPLKLLVLVPANGWVAYTVMEKCARLTMAYAAQFKRVNADGSSDTVSVSGTYAATCPYAAYPQQDPNSPGHA